MTLGELREACRCMIRKAEANGASEAHVLMSMPRRRHRWNYVKLFGRIGPLARVVGEEGDRMMVDVDADEYLAWLDRQEGA